MSSRIQKGVIAGFVATVVVSAADLAATLIQNLMQTPGSDRLFHSFASLLATMARQVFGAGLGHIWIGWLLHLLVGSLVLGPAFAVLAPRIPAETPEAKGILFAVAAWLLMCLTVMPIAGLGFFGLEAGFGTMAWMLVTNIVFGVVLARVFVRQHGDTGHLKRHMPIAE
ncbi:MAG: hypothetical protein J0L52_08845 [Caulobacterales bacterium]|nr:hypothetical protein [Caulobacterales bacterium]